MKWEIGDIVQLHPEHSTLWGGCLMIVIEPKAWGGQGFINIPGQGYAYLRPKFEDGVVVG